MRGIDTLSCQHYMKSDSFALLSFRTPLMDNWYSLSYLYFSTLGTLVTLFVGILVSLPTGNCPNVNTVVLTSTSVFTIYVL